MTRGSSDYPSSVPAAVLSLTLHGGLLALALLGTGRWQPAPSYPAALPRERVSSVRYVVIGAPAVRPVGELPSGSADRASRAPPAAGADRRLLRAMLPALTPSVTPLRMSVDPPRLRVGIPKPEPLAPVRGVAPGARDTAGRDPVPRGVTRGAELLRRAGAACPTIRRPSDRRDPRLTVAVAFVVDTAGAVDRATLRVVESPDRPQTKQEFYPLIYVVGMTARVDPGLSDVAAEYGPIVTRDVLRHVAHLRFRPASRNGRPARSSVLVACQAG